MENDGMKDIAQQQGWIVNPMLRIQRMMHLSQTTTPSFHLRNKGIKEKYQGSR